MRRVVVGKLLVLTLWGSYLAVGLSQPSENGGSGHTITSMSRCLHGRLSFDAARGGHPALRNHAGAAPFLARHGRPLPGLRNAGCASAPDRRTERARPDQYPIPPDSPGHRLAIQAYCSRCGPWM